MKLTVIILNHLLHSSNAAIMFLQEHWLSDHQLQLLSELDFHYLSIGVSDFANSDILTGRPYGGCAMLWSSLRSNSNRICAARMENDMFRLLLINVYMPYEGSDESIEVFTDQLSFICCVFNRE